MAGATDQLNLLFCLILINLNSKRQNYRNTKQVTGYQGQGVGRRLITKEQPEGLF